MGLKSSKRYIDAYLYSVYYLRIQYIHTQIQLKQHFINHYKHFTTYSYI